jgi:glutaredoxin
MQQEIQAIRLFWQPGCSACVKIKEMFTEHGVSFESVNVLENEAGLEEMRRLGIMALPLVFRGEDMAFGQSLDDVAKFVGLDRGVRRLPSKELMAKLTYILDTALELIAKAPEDKLLERLIPERARTVREVSSHIFQIPEAFMAVMDKGLEDSRTIINDRYVHLQTKDQILAYARGVRADLAAWIDANPDLGGEKPFKTYYGIQPASQILERTTWHSAQHTRQLEAVISRLTGAAGIIKPSVYDGLPMPKELWD